MTTAAPTRTPARIRPPVTTPPVDRTTWSWAGLGAAFVLVHTIFAFEAVGVIENLGYNDTDLYRWWMERGLDTGFWPLQDEAWVYPAGAIVPMLLVGLVTTTDFPSYALAWTGLITLLNGAAVWALIRRGAIQGAWWWLAFLAALGPVAAGRLDAVVAPMSILALLAALRHPYVAAAVLTFAAWIKVAPGAFFIALAASVRRPLRDVVLPGALATLGVVVSVWAWGGLSNILSFSDAQGGRGLQLESTAATGWVLASLFREDVNPVFNEPLITWEIVGPGTPNAVAALDFALPAAAALIGALTWWSRRAVPFGALLVHSSLALSLALIVTNKVGSPQFMGWLAAPVAVALAWRGLDSLVLRSAAERGRTVPARRLRMGPPDVAHGHPTRPLQTLAWTPVAVALIVAAALTQWVYPFGYWAILEGSVPETLALVVRNVILAVVFVYVVGRLAVIAWRALGDQEDARGAAHAAAPATTGGDAAVAEEPAPLGAS